MKTGGGAEQSLMQQVCSTLLSAGSEPSPKLEKLQKHMAYQWESDLLLVFESVRLVGEPGDL